MSINTSLDYRLHYGKEVEFRPNMIIVKESVKKLHPSEQSENSKKNLEKRGKYNGYMSPSTIRKVKKYVGTWTEAAKCEPDALKHLTFVTLTLPSRQKHDDKYIKRHLLSKFIQTITRKCEVRNYLWRAEPQKNGNIHFHILLDVGIHWKEVRSIWNELLDKNGYINPYRKKQKAIHKNGFQYILSDKRSRDQQFKAYQYGVSSNWSDPNSTDIHSVRKMKNITAYITKYMTKTGKYDHNGNALRKIEGRIWGCSDSIKEGTYYTRKYSSLDNEYLKDLVSCGLVSATYDIDNEKTDFKIATVYCLSVGQLEAMERLGIRTLRRKYKRHYKDLASSLFWERLIKKTNDGNKTNIPCAA